MTIKLFCKNCGQKLAANLNQAGTTVPCPACKYPITIRFDAAKTLPSPAQIQPKPVPVRIQHEKPVYRPAPTPPPVATRISPPLAQDNPSKLDGVDEKIKFQKAENQSYQEARKHYPDLVDTNSQLFKLFAQTLKNLQASRDQLIENPNYPFIICFQAAKQLGIKAPSSLDQALSTATAQLGMTPHEPSKSEFVPKKSEPVGIESPDVEHETAFHAEVKQRRRKVQQFFPQAKDPTDPINVKASELWNTLLSQKSPIIYDEDAQFIVYSMAAAQLGIKPVQ